MIRLEVHLGHGNIGIGAGKGEYTGSGETVHFITFDELLIPANINEDVMDKEIKNKIRVFIPTLETLAVVQRALDGIKSNIIKEKSNKETQKESEDPLEDAECIMCGCHSDQRIKRNYKCPRCEFYNGDREIPEGM